MFSPVKPLFAQERAMLHCIKCKSVISWWSGWEVWDKGNFTNPWWPSCHRCGSSVGLWAQFQQCCGLWCKGQLLPCMGEPRSKKRKVCTSSEWSVGPATRTNSQYGQGHMPTREGLEGQVRQFAFDAAEKEIKRQVQKIPRGLNRNLKLWHCLLGYTVMNQARFMFNFLKLVS